MPKPLQPVELVALAGAVKPAALKAARDAITEDSVNPVDFRIGIKGTVSRLKGTPSATAKIEVTSTPNLCSPRIVAELFCRLAIKPEKIATHLREIAVIAGTLPADPKRDAIAGLFEKITAENETTRKETRTTNAVAGAIYTAVELRRR